MDTSWLPTTVAMGALGLVWFGIRKDRGSARKDIKEFKAETSAIFLRKEDHIQMCGKAQAELRLEIQKDLYEVKDEIKEGLNEIKLELKNFNQK